MSPASKLLAVALAVAVVAGAAFPGCNSNAGCNAANCETMLKQCHLSNEAEPGLATQNCQRAGQPPSGFDLAQYCPAGCSAVNDGPFYQCMADSVSTCGDSRDGGQAADLAKCQTNAPTKAQACLDQCQTQRTGCEQACPLTSYQACMDCAAQCGLTWAKCEQGCPNA